MTVIDNGRIIARQSIKSFWTGWLAVSAIMAGGKLWTMMTNPEARISEMVGYIGTPVFRRQLAVGCAVHTLSKSLFDHLGNKLLDINSFQRKIYDLTTNVVSVLLGVTSAAILTHPLYRILFYAVSLYSLFEMVVYINGHFRAKTNI